MEETLAVMEYKESLPRKHVLSIVQTESLRIDSFFEKRREEDELRQCTYTSSENLAEREG